MTTHLVQCDRTFVPQAVSQLSWLDTLLCQLLRQHRAQLSNDNFNELQHMHG